MIASLNEALASLDLQPGQTFRTTVNGRELEVRALDETASVVEPVEEPSQFADQVMLEPWFTTPDLPNRIPVTLTFGPIRLPDPPIIPPEDEEFE